MANSNTMIVNSQQNVFLTVNTPNPVAGEAVTMMQPNSGYAMSVFWNFVGVDEESNTPGFHIVLQDSPQLCIDIEATSALNVTEGTGLVLSALDDSNFALSNVWNINSINTEQGVVGQIASTTINFVIDSGNAPASKVWNNASNPYHNWYCVNLS